MALRRTSKDGQRTADVTPNSTRLSGTYSASPDWSTGKPDFDNPKVAINARLFDDFDLDAAPADLIDGKNLR